MCINDIPWTVWCNLLTFSMETSTLTAETPILHQNLNEKNTNDIDLLLLSMWIKQIIGLVIKNHIPL